MVSLFPHPASFRSHLAVDTLAFGFILPTTGRIRDLHPLETCAARRTAKKSTRQSCRILFSQFFSIPIVLFTPVQSTDRHHFLLREFKAEQIKVFFDMLRIGRAGDHHDAPLQIPPEDHLGG